MIFMCSNYFESLKKNSRLIMRALQLYLVKLHFLLKINNFPRMNPLLAAIDLLEALPRVIHDRDKKIHCSIQTERTIFLLYRVCMTSDHWKSVIFYDQRSDVIERFCSSLMEEKHQMSSHNRSYTRVFLNYKIGFWTK